MVGFNWHDRKGFDGAPLLKTIRTLLTGHLPHILPYIRGSISARFDEQYESHPTINGDNYSTLPYEFVLLTYSAGHKVSPVYYMVIGAVAQSNAYAFFGKDLCKLRNIRQS